MRNTDSVSSLDRMGVKAGLRLPLPGEPQTTAAIAAYRRARRSAGISRLCNLLTGRSVRLQRLSDVQASGAVLGCHHAGTQAVPISRIQGSEGRCNDFDRNFRPLRKHNRARWLNVARARLKDINLPPVDLIRVGNDYYVRDGHHRISVARAFGQKDIDAQVTVWHLAPRPTSPHATPRLKPIPLPA